jgi:hypothetical protein
MKPGCLFGPLFWLFGRDIQKSGMSEGNVHSGPGGYEDGGYEGGYAADYFEGEHEET